MAQFYYARDTKVFMTPAGSTAIAWEIPVLDGLSFSQATSSTEITLNEMVSTAGVSRRSRQLFTNAFEPSEWSFSTYMRPFGSVPATSGNGWEVAASAPSGNPQHCVEEALWAYFVGAKHYFPAAADGSTAGKWTTTDAGTTVGGITNSDTNTIIDFTQSEVATLPEFDMYIELGGAQDGADLTYKLGKCVVNEAAIDFDIDGIATINWSGFGQAISEHDSDSGNPPAFTRTIAEGIHGVTSNFIKNRLTTLSVVGTNITAAASGADTYNIVLTGGNLTFSNNVTFLTPETLGVVNLPIGNVTGTRSVSGSATCYLNHASAGSADLFEDLAELTDASANSSAITNSFALGFGIGGSGSPSVQVSLPRCHLDVPSHSVEDIISVDIAFNALPASVEPGATAANYEALITYAGPDLA